MEQQIALIGFGEAASTFASSARWGSLASAYDIDAVRRSAIKQAGVVIAVDPESALAEASVILSLVTASEALSVAKDYGGLIQEGAIWCDMNSVAPDTKAEAAAFIEEARGHYVDAAVLAPVHPARMSVPILVSGPAAGRARSALNDMGFNCVDIAGHKVGRASAIKMIRSVMVKGVEALTYEMMAAAEAAGVAEEVLASLDASEQSDPWSARAAYNLERMTTHGLRRAAEMEEASKTLTALGVEPVMTAGTVNRQREAAHSSKSRKDAA